MGDGSGPIQVILNFQTDDKCPDTEAWLDWVPRVPWTPWIEISNQASVVLTKVHFI